MSIMSLLLLHIPLGSSLVRCILMIKVLSNLVGMIHSFAPHVTTQSFKTGGPKEWIEIENRVESSLGSSGALCRVSPRESVN